MMIGYVLISLLIVASNAMEVESGGYEAVATTTGRAMLESSQQPPLESPVPSRPSRTNHSLVAAIVVLMVLATVALVCCCYMWEHQLRLRIESRNVSEPPPSSSLQDPVSNNNSTMVTMTPSTLIVMIGDDMSQSIAWTTMPHRVSIATLARNGKLPSC